jgi:hypothetical protein
MQGKLWLASNTQNIAEKDQLGILADCYRL